MLYHLSLTDNSEKKIKPILVFGYIQAIIFYLLDIGSQKILKISSLGLQDPKYPEGFIPGPLFIPVIFIACVFVLLASLNFWRNSKKDYLSKLAAISGVIYIFVGISLAVSYYKHFNINPIFAIGLSAGNLLITTYLFFINAELTTNRKIFIRNFIYKLLALVISLSFLVIAFILLRIQLTFNIYIFLSTVFLLLVLTHSFYDWLSTFINDLIYNASSGFSVVNDEEAGQVIKNYNHPGRLEESSLLRLKIVTSKAKKEEITPMDSLKLITKEAIEYFKPQEDPNLRIKRNLKYYLLKMLAYYESEEGQILWELGFEEYPVRIMSAESRERPPKFRITSPADYSYTSRNAYLALKKEAVHDLAWRISYLEKHSK